MTDPSRAEFERAYPAAAADWHEGIQNYVAFAAHYEGWQAAMAHKEVELWIPVTERLPEPYTDVLVWPRPTSYCCEAFVDRDGNWKYDEYAQDYGNISHPCAVTLWQPAPLPQGE